MSAQKLELNWYFLIAGLISLFYGLKINQKIQRSESKRITVELKNDITTVKGRQRAADYRFLTEEYDNQFVILKGSVTADKHEDISNLRGGQIIDLYISNSDFQNLSNKKENIIVVGVSVLGYDLMSKDEYYHNQEMYNLRLKIFSILIALMLLLNGLAKIPEKINYIIVGCIFGAIILMRIFEIGIY